MTCHINKMGIGKFFADIFGRVISNVLVFALTILIVIFGINFFTGINILNFFF